MVYHRELGIGGRLMSERRQNTSEMTSCDSCTEQTMDKSLTNPSKEIIKPKVNLKVFCTRLVLLVKCPVDVGGTKDALKLSEFKAK